MYQEGKKGSKRLAEAEEPSSGAKKRPMTGSNPFRPPVKDARGNPESAALLHGANDSHHNGDLHKQNYNNRNIGNSAIQIGQVVKMQRNNTID